MSSVYLLPELSRSEVAEAIAMARTTQPETTKHGRLILEHSTTIRIEGMSKTKTTIDSDFFSECQSKLAEWDSDKMVKAKPKTVIEDTGLSVPMMGIDLFLEVVCIDDTGIYVQDHESEFWRIDPRGIEEDETWVDAFKLPCVSEPYVFGQGTVKPNVQSSSSLRYCDNTLYIRELRGSAIMYYPVMGGHVYARRAG